jgi:hypothetical protein
MSQGLEQIPAPELQDEYESAPSSADFYLQRPSRFYTRPLREPRPEFPTDENGLVDIDFYQDYLVDPPESVPIEIEDYQRDEWLNQHLYFHGSFYEQREEKGWKRDPILKTFRVTPYNQLVMRRAQEARVHAEMQEHIVPPPIESMQQALEDFQHFDTLGAAALGRRMVLLPESAWNLVGMGFYKGFKGDDFAQALRFFDAEMERALQHLRNPQVISQRVITGVIKRTADLINNERLHREANRRISEDSTYYPIRLQKPGYYYDYGRYMLRNMNVIQLPKTEAELENDAA